jgi:hypothetical protein
MGFHRMSALVGAGAFIVLGVLGVTNSTNPDSSIEVNGMTGMTLGNTATQVVPATSTPPPTLSIEKAVPTLKAPRYGKG